MVRRLIDCMVRVMVFNAAVNNISVISWRSVLLVEETEYQKKTTDMPQVIDKLYHIMLYAQKENLVSTSPIIKITLATCIVQSYCTAGAMVPCSQMLF
jgi:hypothetical protein